MIQITEGECRKSSPSPEIQLSRNVHRVLRDLLSGHSAHNKMVAATVRVPPSSCLWGRCSSGLWRKLLRRRWKSDSTQFLQICQRSSWSMFFLQIPATIRRWSSLDKVKGCSIRGLVHRLYNENGSMPHWVR